MDVERMSAAPPGRRVLFTVTASSVVLLAGAAMGWAASVVLAPPPDVLSSPPYALVDIAHGEVGASISLNAVAEWAATPVGSNLASGTVTTLGIEQGEEVTSGSILYTVDLRPVVLAEGDIPAFRQLAAGAKGIDVRQLQVMLASLGHFSGSADGEFGSRTSAAVKAWQQQLRVEPDGVVRLGDIVFVPDLPMRVSLDSEVVARGATLVGGEEAVLGMPNAPKFTIPISEPQTSLMRAGTRVEISGPGGESWEALVVEQQSSGAGELSVALKGPEDSAICLDSCAVIPPSGQTLLSVRVVTEESVQGLVVPTAALLSRSNGSVAVIDEAGGEIAVTVLASAMGMSIIDGVPEGLRVRVPASVTGT